MKKFLIQMIAIVLAIFGLLAFNTGKLPQFSPFNNTPKINKVHIDNIDLKIEIADTAEARKKGLGGKDSLPSDSGMLFIFPKADYYNFWMKGMKFPIDIIWIKEKKVVAITKNVPPQVDGQLDTDLPIYTPSEPIDSALEVNAGFTDAHNIKIGDSIE